ncbi:hypothetical protein LCGC14_0825660 [marine sediment metagenome]|uniref:FCP1 homology domain-containing protein n=1 Tax=marine sediment metagenome TaxID=412755 RepID=A0A0F9Q2U4_9ZZZZ
MTIKTIMFDLGGVVIDLDFSIFFNIIIAQSPLKTPKTQIMLEFFRQIGNYSKGKMSDDEFYQFACNLLQVCTLDKSKFFNAFNSIISGLDLEVIELIKELRSKYRYKLIALSNINYSHWNYVLNKNWDFIKVFDELILSHEIHLNKPDPKIFEYAIQKAGCEPEEIVFIDDGLNNILSAQVFGITGIKFTDIGELIEELKKIEVM